MPQLKAIVEELISRKAEGVFWDFKLKHHEDNGDLIHDVLCLANAEHAGPRYLVFGVSDPDYKTHPINCSCDRRTQADIASIFRDNASKFAESRFPEFHLETVKIDGSQLDVLVIQDQPFKPYYLIEQCHGLHASHIYSRVCDTNTPKNKGTQPHEIERMWQERFGLNLTPLERAKIYLLEPGKWTKNSFGQAYDQMYHTQFPEFTLRKLDKAVSFLGDGHEWTRGEYFTDEPGYCDWALFYHQTGLASVPHVSFDNNRKSMVAPAWMAREKGRFYYYPAGGIYHAIQVCFANRDKRDDSKCLGIRGDGGQISDNARNTFGKYVDIPVVDEEELSAFMRYSGMKRCKPIRDKDKQYFQYLKNRLDFEIWRKRNDTQNLARSGLILSGWRTTKLKGPTNAVLRQR